MERLGQLQSGDCGGPDVTTMAYVKGYRQIWRPIAGSVTVCW